MFREMTIECCGCDAQLVHHVSCTHRGWGIERADVFYMISALYISSCLRSVCCLWWEVLVGAVTVAEFVKRAPVKYLLETRPYWKLQVARWEQGFYRFEGGKALRGRSIRCQIFTKLTIAERTACRKVSFWICWWLYTVEKDVTNCRVRNGDFWH